MRLPENIKKVIDEVESSALADAKAINMHKALIKKHLDAKVLKGLSLSDEEKAELEEVEALDDLSLQEQKEWLKKSLHNMELAQMGEDTKDMQDEVMRKKGLRDDKI